MVGDSLAHNANYRRIEAVTNTTVKTTKAYSSAWDKSARYKEMNITDVSKKELKNSTFDQVVLAAPTVDISNLNTVNAKASDDMDVFKQKVGTSCENMMKVAKDALANVKKVTIMNHAPRYDTHSVDPMGLKQKLAKYANNYMLELWLDCPMKDKIFIGRHNLECTGEERIKRYKDDHSGRYDGVHHNSGAGKAVYTESVLDIVLSSLQTEVPDDEHTWVRGNAKQSRTYSSALNGKTGVKTQNRFSPLGGNMGNC